MTDTQTLRGFATVNYRAHDVTASVGDPFGNVLGVMDNPHSVERLGR